LTLLTLNDDDALALKAALHDLPHPKKMHHSRIVEKLLGSKAIYGCESINSISGLLEQVEERNAPPFAQKRVRDGHNYVIDNGHVEDDDIEMLFGEEDVELLDPTVDMLDVLVRAKVFPSKGRARKNGWQGREDIPPGWTEFTIGKRKHKIFIWNPAIRTDTGGD
jgi:hypothetical protein